MPAIAIEKPTAGQHCGDRPRTSPNGVFVGGVAEAACHRYCLLTYTAPQSWAIAGARTPRVNRLSRPDASITRSAVSAVAPILTPAVRVPSRTTASTLPVTKRTRPCRDAARHSTRSNVSRLHSNPAVLLKLAVEWAVAGDDEPVAVVDRAAMRRVLEQTDPDALLRAWAAMTSFIDARLAGLFHALEVAAGSDDEARRLADKFSRQRLDGARRIVESLISLDALRTGLARGDAIDLAWLSTDPVLFQRLVRTRRWSVRRFETWLGDSLRRQLLDR